MIAIKTAYFTFLSKTNSFSASFLLLISPSYLKQPSPHQVTDLITHNVSETPLEFTHLQ